MQETPYQKFEKKSKEKYADFLNEYRASINLSRNKDKLIAHNLFKNKIVDLERKTPVKLGIHSRFLIEIEDELKANKFKKIENEFDNKFKIITDTSKIKLLENLSEMDAIPRTLKYLFKEGKKYELKNKKQTATKTINIQWKGKNSTEFAQFIYALFGAGYLTNDKSEITKLVVDTATVFNFKLTNNWQSNLSKSIHESNRDYQPEIFAALQKKYEEYRDKKLKIATETKSPPSKSK
jgi:hypothetical protein